jgi:coenzyme F420-reducing hydrogenase delta subunit|tara:strand:- start:173 stop:349 length:177 start_codon:yes stop_codon:yes gene_type:complete
MNKQKAAKKIEYMNFLIEEISIQKNRIEDTDMGHIHTTVNVLQKRVEEVQKELMDLYS